MAPQQINPPPWKSSYGDGCTGIPDWFPFVGSIRICCDNHDEEFWCGGGEADFIAANAKFEKCIGRKWCIACKLLGWAARRGVKYFGRSNFNWLGPRRLPLIERKKYDRNVFNRNSR